MIFQAFINKLIDKYFGPKAQFTKLQQLTIAFIFLVICFWVQDPFYFQPMIEFTDYIIIGKTDGWGILMFLFLYGILLYWFHN